MKHPRQCTQSFIRQTLPRRPAPLCANATLCPTESSWPPPHPHHRGAAQCLPRWAGTLDDSATANEILDTQHATAPWNVDAGVRVGRKGGWKGGSGGGCKGLPDGTNSTDFPHPSIFYIYFFLVIYGRAILETLFTFGQSVWSQKDLKLPSSC